ncbi:MAG: nicotinate phosphoribosyltransferase [Candidatus Doudnabacteria bacterium]
MELPSYLPKSHLVSEDELLSFEITSSFSYLKVWEKYKMDKAMATFDVLTRDMPKNRNFMVFTGLEEIVQTILNLKFSNSDIEILKKSGVINKKNADYLKTFKFSGSIDAMEEGTIFFPGEPILRVTAPLREATLFYVYFTTVIPSNTIFSTKCIRLVLVAKGKNIVVGANRAHSFESMAKCIRSAYIVGCMPGSSPGYIRKYGFEETKFIKATVHYFIKSFPSELEAMSTFAETFPDNEATLIVDTYDFARGVENAIQVCQQLKRKGKKVHSLYIDSGDLSESVTFARRKLDQAGLQDVEIMIARNLNEWRIKELMDKKIPFDSCLVVTEPATSFDDPRLEIVYKMAQLEDRGVVRQTMKLSPEKKSLPGRKQVYRIMENNKIKKDIIGLEDEDVRGKKLLVPIIKNGKLVYGLPKISEIREYTAKQVKQLPERLRELEVQIPSYKVEISPGLRKLSKMTQEKVH